MTNKLPVVGNRYRATESNKLVLNKDIPLICDEVSEGRVIIGKGINGGYLVWPVKDFFEDFEELPEDKAATKPETQSPELSPEVKEAMERLEREVRIKISGGMRPIKFGEYSPITFIKEYRSLLERAKYLLNALGKQFNQASESVDVKEEEIKKEESIWRHDCEMTQEQYKYCLPSKSIVLHPHETKHLQLSDFINDYEKLKERVKKLEKSQ